MLIKFAAEILVNLLMFSYIIQSFPLEENNPFSDESVIELPYLGNAVFKEPNPQIGEKLESWNETHLENPEEFGEYIEGDIVFPQITRNGLSDKTFRWENGVIPYVITGIFPTNDLNNIFKAINIYKKYTCITFRTRLPTDKDYIAILNGPTGCWSSVGRIKGRQEINLQSPYCTTKVGTPLHELMHAVGFLHEQNRYERDDYVSIAWQNIKKGHEANFDKANQEKTHSFGVPYDFRSVMHYSSRAFSANGNPTIIPKNPVKEEKMGQRDGFSKGDITKINMMYNCPEKTESIIKDHNLETTAKSDTEVQSNSNNSFLSVASNFLSSLFVN